jgi:hypothetical protein
MDMAKTVKQREKAKDETLDVQRPVRWPAALLAELEAEAVERRWSFAAYVRYLAETHPDRKRRR